jgi:hypothetical protein
MRGERAFAAIIAGFTRQATRHEETILGTRQ